MVGRTSRSVWIDLTLIHDNEDSSVFTTALCLIPRHSVRAGTSIEQIIRKKTVWIATLYEGIPECDEFSEALEATLTVLEKNHDFLANFAEYGGRIVVNLNHSIGWDQGVLSDITLEAPFMAELSPCSAALQVRGWSADDWPDFEVVKALSEKTKLIDNE